MTTVRVTTTVFMKGILMALCLLPILAAATPTIIVDSIPAGAAFFNLATVKPPYHDLDEVDSKEVEAGIALVISDAMQLSETNAITYICLLSAPGANTRSFKIDAAHSMLNLQRIDPSFVIVLYRGGHDTTDRIKYSLDGADSRRKRVTMTFDTASTPVEWTTAAWVYSTLSKIQDAVSKAGATQVFLSSTGKGITSPVLIPGMQDPLMVFTDEATISATWYVQNAHGVEASRAK
jgi:hypothetical protein